MMMALSTARFDFVLKTRVFLHFLCPFSINKIASEFCYSQRPNYNSIANIGKTGNVGGNGNCNGKDPMYRKSVVEKCKRGFTNLHEALELYQEMISKSPPPSIVEFNQLNAAIARMKRYSAILDVYRQLELVGISANDYSLAIMMNCYCQLSRVDLGFSVFAKILKLGFRPDCVTFNTLLNGVAVNGGLSQAMEFLDKIVHQGFRPNKVTFSSLVNRFMVSDNLVDVLRTYPGLVDLLCKAGMVNEAFRVLESMFQRGEAPNGIAYETVIRGYCSTGEVDEALKMLRVILNRGYKPDLTTYTTLIRRCCSQHRMVDQALNVFHEASQRGLVLDVDTCIILINSCSRTGRVQVAQKLLEHMRSHGPTPDIVTCNFVINGLY